MTSFHFKLQLPEHLAYSVSQYWMKLRILQENKDFSMLLYLSTSETRTFWKSCFSNSLEIAPVSSTSATAHVDSNSSFLLF